MICSHYGCNFTVKYNQHEGYLECPVHGKTMSVYTQEENPSDWVIAIRVAQARMEIADMVRAGKKHIFH